MDEETEPLWLSQDNDHLHVNNASKEDLPLFGTGRIPLEGEVPDNPPPADDEGFPPNYGSTQNSKESPAPSSKSGTSKGKSKKKKKEAPKSIFDDENPADDDSSFVSDIDSATAEILSTKPHMPTRIWCLEFFRVVNGVTITACLGLLATQMIPLFLAPLASQGYFDLALKVYNSLFNILFILVEFNAPLPIIKDSQLLQSWVPRGCLMSYVGLVCLEESYSERVKEIIHTHADEFHVAWASLFMQISLWLMLGCGVFYMLMGMCCLQKVRNKLRQKDKDLWKRYRRELKEWKRLNP
jgi:hypothetical protein